MLRKSHAGKRYDDQDRPCQPSELTDLMGELTRGQEPIKQSSVKQFRHRPKGPILPPECVRSGLFLEAGFEPIDLAASPGGEPLLIVKVTREYKPAYLSGWGADRHDFDRGLDLPEFSTGYEYRARCMGFVDGEPIFLVQLSRGMDKLLWGTVLRGNAYMFPNDQLETVFDLDVGPDGSLLVQESDRNWTRSRLIRRDGSQRVFRKEPNMLGLVTSDGTVMLLGHDINGGYLWPTVYPTGTAQGGHCEERIEWPGWSQDSERILDAWADSEGNAFFLFHHGVGRFSPSGNTFEVTYQRFAAKQKRFADAPIRHVDINRYFRGPGSFVQQDALIAYRGESSRHALECWRVDDIEQPGFDLVSGSFKTTDNKGCPILAYYGLAHRHLCLMKICNL